MPYQFLADLVLFTHFAIVVFVIGGLAVILIGNWLGWHWVNNWCFRVVHLAAIVIVVIQAWLGQLCPLTILESWLREQAGETVYTTSFISHWLRKLLYYDAPLWVFAIIYTLFAALVAAAWWYFPPTRRNELTHKR